MAKKASFSVRINDVVHTINYGTKPRKDGRLQAYIPNGYKSDNSIKYKQIYGHNVYELMDKAEAFLKGIEDQKPHNKLFRDDILDWFYDVKARNMRDSSADSMEATIKRLIIQNLEDDDTLESNIKTVNVTSGFCRKLLNNLFDQGKSHSYTNKAYIFLNQFFKFTYNNGIIKTNPMLTVSIPSKERFDEKRAELGISDNNRRYLLSEEVAKIQDVIYNGYHPVAKSRSGKEYKMNEVLFEQPEVFDFMLNSGLRAGEMLSLKFSDWNPEKKDYYNKQKSRKS